MYFELRVVFSSNFSKILVYPLHVYVFYQIQNMARGILIPDERMLICSVNMLSLSSQFYSHVAIQVNEHGSVFRVAHLLMDGVSRGSGYLDCHVLNISKEKCITKSIMLVVCSHFNGRCIYFSPWCMVKDKYFYQYGEYE